MSLASTVGKSLSVAVVVALALYPMLVYAAIGRFGPSGVAGVLAAVCLARLVVLKLPRPAGVRRPVSRPRLRRRHLARRRELLAG